MALINCPECKHEVSSTAKSCPKCGCSIKGANFSLSKELVLSAIVVLIFVLGLMISNPDKEQFVKYMNTELTKKIDDSGGMNPSVKNIASGIANLFLNAAVDRVSYGVFSIFKIDLSLPRSFGKDAPDRKFIGVAGVFLPLDGLGSSTKTDASSATTSQKGLMSCKDFDRNIAGDAYFKNMDALAKHAKLTNGWYRDTEDFVYQLCNGDTKGADAVVANGGIQIDEAANVAKVLGINYTPPKRDAKSLLYEMTQRKLVEFMCTACAGNAAAYFVENPNTDTGKMIKRAMDGDKAAISILQDPAWSAGAPK